jgi:superfamily II DNA/RNA helicase
MNFADLGLSPEVLRAIAELGYEQPTPIQEQAIQVVLMGRDMLGCAQTGTGKTAAFVLPMIDILNHGRAKARMPRSLIIEPTRELAAQVAENFDKYGKYCELSMALLIGGESFVDQEKKLDRGVDVLIATPGRLLDLYERGKILMSDVKILVIDEADRMLDMGFIPDVERIVSLLPKLRQTLFFSATMGPEVRRLADAFLMNPKEITVSKSATTATTVTQGYAIVDELDKREALRRLIRTEDVANALVFCNRKKDVDILCRSLQKHGFSAAQMHGDMAQPKRVETLDKFKKGEITILVCSDVAARGIDIAGLSHVFNFDVPFHAEDYVHRIGRTGRAGREGRALMLATPYEGKELGAIVQLIGKDIPRIEIEGINQLPFEEGDARRRRGRGGRSGGKAEGPRGGTRRGKPEGRSRSRPDAPPAPPAVTAEAKIEAIIEQAIPHPSAELHRHDLLEASTALPVTLPVTLAADAHETRPAKENRHRRRAHGRESERDESDSVAASGSGPFGDHTPAFFARAGRPANIERRVVK